MAALGGPLRRWRAERGPVRKMCARRPPIAGARVSRLMGADARCSPVSVSLTRSEVALCGRWDRRCARVRWRNPRTHDLHHRPAASTDDGRPFSRAEARGGANFNSPCSNPIRRLQWGCRRPKLRARRCLMCCRRRFAVLRSTSVWRPILQPKEHGRRAGEMKPVQPGDAESSSCGLGICAMLGG